MVLRVFFCSQAGSLYIKVKRDADEQEVLHQVTSKLAGHVTHLTVHITKDEWNVSPMVSHSGSGVLGTIRTPNINNPLLNKMAAQMSATHMNKGPIQQSHAIGMSSKAPQPNEQPLTFNSSSNNTLLTINEKV